MSLVINLTEPEEVRLANEARLSGVSTTELAAAVLREHLATREAKQVTMVREKIQEWQKYTATKTEPRIPTAELFAQADREYAAMSQEEQDAEDELWRDIEYTLLTKKNRMSFAQETE